MPALPRHLFVAIIAALAATASAQEKAAVTKYTTVPACSFADEPVATAEPMLKKFR